MQIQMVTQNNINVVVGRASQPKHQSAQMPGNAFDGPQCKVTISKEGRRLNEQSNGSSGKSAQSLKAEKMMLRQQKQSEYADETQSEYLTLIEEIDKAIKSMQKANMPGEDLTTIEKKQSLIREMQDQKQKQMEANQKKAKEAQQMATQSSELQDEIDENNRDLLIMLKSIEASEKAEEEREGGSAEEGSSDGGETQNSVSDMIHNSASRFVTSSMKRELGVVGSINALYEEGLQNLARADEIEQKASMESDSLKALLADETISDDEKREAVMSYGLKMAPKAQAELEILLGGAKYTQAEKEAALDRYQTLMKSDSDLADYRRRGLQMIKDAKECKSDHLAMNPLQGMEETRNSMIQSAVDAAFHEASQGKLDEASQELEDEVKDLIDERNDIDSVESEENQDEEEEKEIGELLELFDPEEQPEEDEKKLEETAGEQVTVTQG